MTNPLPLLLAAVLLVAGCVGEPVEDATAPPAPPTPDGEPEPLPAAPPPVNVTRFNGTVAGAGHPDAAHVRLAGENVFEFEVPENATGIVVEVAWSDSAALDVRVDVPVEHCAPFDPLGLLVRCPPPHANEDGKSPVRIEITDAESLARPGAWRVGTWARSAANPVPFTVTVSVFEGAAPPMGYTTGA